MMDLVYEHQADFLDGKVENLTKIQILEQLAILAEKVGMPRDNFFAAMSSDISIQQLKFEQKYGKSYE
jgi:hypothetical protein